MSRRYRRFLAIVSTQSRFAAFCVPHMLFATVMGSFHYFIGRTIVPILRLWGLMIFAFVLPQYKILRALYLFVDVVLCSDNNGQQLLTPCSPSLVHTPRTPTRNESSSLAALSIAQSAPPMALPSDVIRRRRTTRIMDGDGMRQRASLVAQSLEEEGEDHGNTNHNMDISTPTSIRRRPNTFIPESSSSSISLLATAPRLRRRRVSTAVGTATPSTPRTSSATMATMETPTSNSRRNDNMPTLNLPQLSEDFLRLREETKLLHFCIVFSMVWLPRSVLWLVCPTILNALLTATDVGLFYFALWAQLSLTSGSELVYALLAKFFRRNGLVRRTARHAASSVQGALSSAATVGTALIHGDDDEGDDDEGDDSNDQVKRGNEREDVAQLSTIVRLLPSLNITKWLNFPRLWRLVSGTKFGFYIAIFLFTLVAIIPKFIVLPVLLLTGIVWPCLCSVSVLEHDFSSVANAMHGNDSRSTEAAELDEEEVKRQDWLAYWSVFATIEVFYAFSSDVLSWVPFWYNAKLAVVLWLLLHGGAPGFLDSFMMKISFALSIVKQSIVNIRRSTRQSR